MKQKKFLNKFFTSVAVATASSSSEWRVLSRAPFGDSLEAGLELLLHDVFPVATQDPGHQLEQQRAVTEFQGVQQLKSGIEKTAFDFLGDVRRLAC